MDGAHFVPTKKESDNDDIITVPWRQMFPDWVRSQLTSFKNPHGPITNSDLELAGSIAHNNILA